MVIIIPSEHALIKVHSELRSGQDEFHTSDLALKMMCEPAMVVAADLLRSWVMSTLAHITSHGPRASVVTNLSPLRSIEW